MASGESKLLEKKRLEVEQIRRRIDPGKLDFKTTDDVEPLVGTVGQERALEALEDGLNMKMAGFNVYASGRTGTGRNSTVRAHVDEMATQMPVPDDWVYLFNFDEEEKPRAVRMPSGKGRDFAKDMDDFIEEAKQEIPKAFESEEHAKEKAGTVQKVKEKQEEMLRDLDKQAREELDHTIRATPQGLNTVPIDEEGEPISQEDFENLDEKKKEDLREKSKKLQQMIAEAMSQAKRMEKRMKEETQEQDRKVALFAVGHLIDDLKKKYKEFEDLQEYLDAVKEDVIDNLDAFTEEQNQQLQMLGMKPKKDQALKKYKVNVFVDHRNSEGAPVIDERNPTYYNLLGKLEYQAQFGGMSTDFSMLKAGAFQRASGGFLILQVLDVLRHPFAWEGLKRTLRKGEAKIENMWGDYQAVPAATLKPEAIPVDVKVILVGSPMVYQLLNAYDNDFHRLFKIKADFDVEMDFTDEHLEKYAEFVRARCEENDLPPFTREAVARIAEEGTRLTGHQERLSARFLAIADLIAEAGYRAKQNGGKKAKVEVEDVKTALEACRRRSRMIQDKIQRMIEEDVILIDTEDSETGQVNGLAVLDIGDYRFGRPNRITCVTSVGRGGVVNIERESKMSGSIHDKGVLIMSSFVRRRFGRDKPLALDASIAFEQSYSGIEGDSASCAELYTLLSSLSDLPLRQDIAVTGSVNQRGQVQPIGGANEKIEGFFEVCKLKGLTGDQGVMIPSRNVRHLMLNDEVVEAVEKGKFSIYAVETVDEGIEILTGVEAGFKGDDGKYPEGSVYGRADRRLKEMAEVLKDFGPMVSDGSEGRGDGDSE
jgi:lon-related putative ATP-dependent protease